MISDCGNDPEGIGNETGQNLLAGAQEYSLPGPGLGHLLTTVMEAELIRMSGCLESGFQRMDCKA